MCHGQCVDVKLLMNQLTRHKFVKTKERERERGGPKEMTPKTGKGSRPSCGMVLPSL